MNKETNKTLKEGVNKSFEALEAVRSIVADEMLIKTTTLLKIMITGEVKEDLCKEICKEMEKDQEKIDKLNKLIELKEEYVKLFEEEE